MRYWGDFMDVLIRYGFSIEEITNMMDSNQEIEKIEDKDIYELIDILINIGCINSQIKNIFICNPFCISRNIIEIQKSIDKFKELKLDNLNIIFDSNPYLLNLDEKEIETIYNNLEKDSAKEEIYNYFYTCSNIIIQRGCL